MPLDLTIPPDVPFPVLLPTLTRIQFQAKSATLFFNLFYFLRRGSLMIPGTNVAPFYKSLWAVVFHCLRNFFIPVNLIIRLI